jgi:predicted DsbA family dithiol-disulfide isomerase
VRLSEIQQAYGDRVAVHWRTFPLIPDQRPGRRCTPETQAGRARVAAEEPRACFVAPPLEAALPSSSVPALTAAKCAERQGEEAFARFHARLFLACFRDSLDVSRLPVLRDLARECELDLARFDGDYAGGEAYEAVLRDYAEGAAWFGVSALPTVIFNEKVSLVGAVPTDRYRALVDWLLAGEPGGLIRLPSGAEAPGRSVVPRPESR